MINIIKYINNDKWQPTYKISNEYLYEELKDFFIDIPNDYIKLYENNCLYKIGFDYINEHLKNIEPIYSEDASEYFNKCHRQAYHFTYKKNIEGILKNGLRLKHEIYREFPERIYLWATDKKQDINDNNKELLDFIHKIFGNDKLSLKDIGIIKVDLYHTNFPAYKDTAMKEKEAIFVYNNIPANLCKEIK